MRHGKSPPPACVGARQVSARGDGGHALGSAIFRPTYNPQQTLGGLSLRKEAAAGDHNISERRLTSGNPAVDQIRIAGT
jgi:hypothetical protein